MVPKDIRTVDAVPVLGTGKVDYVGVKSLVEDCQVEDCQVEKSLS